MSPGTRIRVGDHAPIWETESLSTFYALYSTANSIARIRYGFEGERFVQTKVSQLCVVRSVEVEDAKFRRLRFNYEVARLWGDDLPGLLGDFLR